ncbi:MAG TPA: ATP-binding protein, partial [Phenylobacterium sp.]|nr:ATP-binding protein [Phenylobacterium sp.]
IYTLGLGPTGAPREAMIALYAVSGAATVMVSAALREALLRMDEAQAAEAKIRAELTDSEARFRLLADSAPAMMWVSRTDGSREFANRAYVAYLDVPFEEALVFDWRKRLHPGDLDRILAEQAAGEASRAIFSLEARYRRPDGEYRWIRSISQPRQSPDGAFAGFIGLGYDVTDTKQAEADLKRINDLLADRVQAALAERDVAEDALRRAQKLEAVGQLTGGVAHDFNNLLTVIIGALDLMQRHPADAARRERMVEAALGAARRGERLNQQLLAFSRRQALKPEMVCIDDLLVESETLLLRAVGEAVTVTFALGAPGAVTNVDPSQFEAAVMNLVVNARDATPPGGAIRVESLCATLTPELTLEAPPGDYLCVAVHDTGPGMTRETLERAFEPFFTTKGPGRGTGLGLSQVYGFARQSGGAVLIDTAPGKGASVRVYLPLASEPDAPAPEAAAPAPHAEPPGPGRRVLLVEDDKTVGDVIEAMLADLGHTVLRAASAPEALILLRRGEPIDLMLTDVIMPGGKTGVDLAHEAIALRPSLPVILSSGYTGDTLGPASEAPWPLLRKPYDSETLARTVDSVAASESPSN